LVARPLTFKTYQDAAGVTDVGTSAQKSIGIGWLYYVLGVAGETGELVEKVKKLFRDSQGIVTEKFRQQIIKEMGDILWYMARLCSWFNISLEEVARENCIKLNSRLERNKIHGEGDNR
jgi:NTP pyrophosphatase (non-canonical NTP hydrolase)